MNTETINIIKQGIEIKFNKLTTLPIINVEKGKPQIRYEDGVLYHLLSIVIEIMLCVNRYEEEVINYFTKYSDFPPYESNLEIIDIYSYNNRLFRGNAKTKSSGSSISNDTYVYCYDIIDQNILDVFKTPKQNSIAIIFPTVVPTVIKDIVYLFTYIADEVTLSKNADWLKDSFLMTAKNLDKFKLKTIYSKIKTNQQVDRLVSDKQQDFNKTYAMFLSKIGTCIYDIWDKTIYKINENNTKRNSEYWSEYDKLFFNYK